MTNAQSIMNRHYVDWKVDNAAALEEPVLRTH